MPPKRTAVEQVLAFLATRKGRALVAGVLLTIGPAVGLPTGAAELAVEYAYDLECVPAGSVVAAPVTPVPVAVPATEPPKAPDDTPAETEEPTNTAGADQLSDAPLVPPGEEPIGAPTE
jgi:hypothetical protein